MIRRRGPLTRHPVRVPTLHEFLQARQLDNNDWAFTVPAELHGAFGGAFGGVVASCTLVAARAAAPGRMPNALDIRFLRGLPAGDAVTTTTVLHAGRSLTNVAVDLSDASGRLCARSTISLVDSAVLHPFEETQATPRGWDDYESASSFPPVAPIVSVIDPRFVGRSGADIATAIRIPWDDARPQRGSVLHGRRHGGRRAARGHGAARRRDTQPGHLPALLRRGHDTRRRRRRTLGTLGQRRRDGGGRGVVRRRARRDRRVDGAAATDAVSDSIAVVVNECQRGSIGDLALWPALRDAAAPIVPVIARLLDAAPRRGRSGRARPGRQA